ncbi:YcxB family protein [Bradyrhizobium sp. STM 3561]|uniref:YcxB family protein n=1 Tax=Bradyrhizobium sp. STM 3561 TaxID=578923 RepID=UPI00388FF871
MTWNVTLDDSSIVVRTPGSERRTSWHSIKGVTDAPTMVGIWYNSGQGFFIPARAFSDPSARAAFAEWASERLRSATVSSSAVNSA